MSSAKRSAPPPKAQRRIATSMRLSRATHALLSARAQESGRSLTQEIELCVEQSFHVTETLTEGLTTAFGTQGAAVLLLLARVLRSTPLRLGLGLDSDWLSNPAAYATAVRQIAVVLEILRPVGEGTPALTQRAEAEAHRLMLLFGDTTLPLGPFSAWAVRLREGLGPAVTERAIEWRKAHLAKTFPEPEDEP
jgi:hypothetical protein